MVIITNNYFRFCFVSLLVRIVLSKHALWSQALNCLFVCLVLFFFRMCVWQHYLGPPLWLAEFAVTFDTVVLLIVASCDAAETLGLTITTRPLLIFRTIICDTRCCCGCGCCCCSWDGTIVTRLFFVFLFFDEFSRNVKMIQQNQNQGVNKMFGSMSCEDAMRYTYFATNFRCGDIWTMLCVLLGCIILRCTVKERWIQH